MALHHPNIVHVYDIGVFEGHDFIAMEYVEGQSLRQILRERHLEVAEALRYAAQVADAMAAAHAAGIVHRFRGRSSLALRYARTNLERYPRFTRLQEVLSAHIDELSGLVDQFAVC